jgi:hypothetical protein
VLVLVLAVTQGTGGWRRAVVRVLVLMVQLERGARGGGGERGAALLCGTLHPVRCCLLCAAVCGLWSAATACGLRSAACGPCGVRVRCVCVRYLRLRYGCGLGLAVAAGVFCSMQPRFQRNLLFVLGPKKILWAPENKTGATCGRPRGSWHVPCAMSHVPIERKTKDERRKTKEAQQHATPTANTANSERGPGPLLLYIAYK